MTIGDIDKKAIGVLVTRGYAFVETLQGVGYSLKTIEPISKIPISIESLEIELKNFYEREFLFRVATQKDQEEFGKGEDQVLKIVGAKDFKDLVTKGAISYGIYWMVDKVRISVMLPQKKSYFEGDKSRSRTFLPDVSFRTLAEAIVEDAKLNPEVWMEPSPAKKSRKPPGH